MRLEHLAFVVQEPAEVAGWYVAHLGFTVKRALDVSPFPHFLVDASGE